MTLSSVRVIRDIRGIQFLLGNGELACTAPQSAAPHIGDGRLANIGPMGAIAPECLSHRDSDEPAKAHYSTPADIFSFGVLLHDLLEISRRSAITVAPLAALHELQRHCVRRDAAKRPSAAALVRELQRLRTQQANSNEQEQAQSQSQRVPTQ